MNKISKIFGAVAIAGIVAAGSSAFTAGGLIRTAPASITLGGTVTQSVVGVLSLDTIDYTYTDDSNELVNSIELTFDEAATGRTVTALLNGTETVTCSIAAEVATCAVAPALNVSSVAVTVV